MSNRVRESNTLQIWGNKDSMNMNSMILTNIQSSTYFKQKLFELKTYHEVIDEIYYRVNHLEPWEKGSRRTQGLTGMCGGVRGVGGGGIVSTAFCLLYKLYTIKMTRKQVIGLITHQDSPYIRALGFMYIRYTQNPSDLLHWYFDYLDDEEELDVRAGGGHLITIGQMLRQWLTKLEWFDTLFPRIPVPIQNEIFEALQSKYGSRMDTIAFYDINNSSKSTGRESSSRSASKRTPPPEIAEVIKKSRSSRSESRDRSDSKGRSRRTRSRSLKRKSDEKSKKRSHRSTSSRPRSRSSHSSHSDRERRRHRHRKHSPKRSDKDEERHKHRHRHKHSRHHDDEDDREKRKRDENKHSKDKESKAKKESKKNETDSDST